MKANELRIGNWVTELLVNNNSFVDTPIQLHTVGEYVISAVNNNKVKPIKLTEEWLIKFGFESNGIAFLKNGYIIWIQENKYVFALYEAYSNNELFTEIKYVHQIQNLYFALTGNELEINGTK